MMKLRMLFVLLFASISFPLANAAPLTSEFCTILPGFWVGEEHIRDSRLCDMFNGCTHMMTVNITHKGDNTYQLEDQWSDGKNIHQETASFTCDNGVIKLPTTEKYEISGSCDAGNHCFGFINSTRFTAELVKQ